MGNYVLQQRDTTDLLYSRALDRGQRAMFWAALTGRSRCLRALEEVRQGGCLSTGEQNPTGAETRLVPLDQIVGSEGRCADFDRDFNPLSDHTRGRWIRVAAARQRGTELPPVDLMQVGDLLFVQDGHHRISVARALGQPDIEARVTLWQVSGPLPWETEAKPAKQRAGQLAGLGTVVGRLYRQIVDQVRALQPGQAHGALPGGSRL
jgi:hypothetical protein